MSLRFLHTANYSGCGKLGEYIYIYYSEHEFSLIYTNMETTKGISLQQFKQAIKEHKSVVITYASTATNGADYQLRYDMDEKGCIREVMTAAKKVMFAARLEGDDERLADVIYLETAKAITPTPAKDRKRIDYTMSDELWQATRKAGAQL